MKFIAQLEVDLDKLDQIMAMYANLPCAEQIQLLEYMLENLGYEEGSEEQTRMKATIARKREYLYGEGQ